MTLGQRIEHLDQIWSTKGQGLMSYSSDLEMTLDDLGATYWTFGPNLVHVGSRVDEVLTDEPKHAIWHKIIYCTCWPIIPGCVGTLGCLDCGLSEFWVVVIMRKPHILYVQNSLNRSLVATYFSVYSKNIVSGPGRCNYLRIISPHNNRHYFLSRCIYSSKDDTQNS